MPETLLKKPLSELQYSVKFNLERTESVPKNEQQITQEAVEAVGKTLEKYLDTLSGPTRKRIEGLMEQEQLTVIGRYHNDGSNPIPKKSKFVRGDFKNNTLTTLDLIFNISSKYFEYKYHVDLTDSRGVSEIDVPLWRVPFLDYTTEEERSVTGCGYHVTKYVEGSYGDFNSIPGIQNISKKPLELKKSFEHIQPIDSIHINTLVEVDDLNTGYYYYHSHPVYIQKIEIEGKICVYVTVQDIGEKLAIRRPLSKDNVSDVCSTFVYVIEPLEDSNQIPLHNLGVKEVTMIKIVDSEKYLTKRKINDENRAISLMRFGIEGLGSEKSTIKDGTLYIGNSLDKRKIRYEEMNQDYQRRMASLHTRGINPEGRAFNEMRLAEVSRKLLKTEKAKNEGIEKHNVTAKSIQNYRYNKKLNFVSKISEVENRLIQPGLLSIVAAFFAAGVFTVGAGAKIGIDYINTDNPARSEVLTKDYESRDKNYPIVFISTALSVFLRLSLNGSAKKSERKRYDRKVEEEIKNASE